MTLRTLRLLGALAVLGVAAGCSDGPTEPLDYDADLAAAFEMMAADANRTGDADGAAAYSSGALAVRMGVRPTDITVYIDGQAVPHKAIVAAVVRSIGTQDPILMRSFMAWSGGPRPVETILEVSMLREEAEFGHPMSFAPQRQARGWFADMVARIRYLATAGEAKIKVESLGAACDRPVSDNPTIRCRKARFEVEVEGDFHRRAPGDPPTSPATKREIKVDEGAVNGVIVAPQGLFDAP